MGVPAVVRWEMIVADGWALTKAVDLDAFSAAKWDSA